MWDFNAKNSAWPIRCTVEDVDITETADNNAGKDGDALNAPPPQPHNKSKEKQQRRPKPSNSFSALSMDDGDGIDASTLYSENQGSCNEFNYDSDLQTALLLSKTLSDEDDKDEELQKALLLSSMDFAAESNLGKGCDDFDLGDLKMNFAAESSLGKDRDSSDLGELNLANHKMKGVCRPPDMNPDRVELAAFNKLTLGEASTSVCVLCSDELPTGKLTRLSDKCGHFCCRGCAGDYLGRAMKENIRGEIKCPGNKCKEILSWFRCCLHIPQEVVERREKALEETKALKKLVEEEAAQRELDGIWSNPRRRNNRLTMWGPFGPDRMMNGRRNMMMGHPDMMRDRMRESAMMGRRMKGRMMDPTHLRRRFMDLGEDPHYYAYEAPMEHYEEEEWLQEFWFRYDREPTKLEYQAFLRRQMEDRYERYGRRGLDRLDDELDEKDDEWDEDRLDDELDEKDDEWDEDRLDDELDEKDDEWDEDRLDDELDKKDDEWEEEEKEDRKYI